MKESHVIAFAPSRPFEPFYIFLTDGRRIEFKHPESVIIAEYAAFVWIFHPTQEIEVIDVAMITSLKTIGAVDPSNYIR